MGINCSLKENKKMEMCKRIPKPLISYFGGKQRVAHKIISKFPDHHTYVEPFVGGGSVYWANTIPNKFVISDLNKDIYKLYKTAKNSPSSINKCGTNFEIRNKDRFDKLKKKPVKSSCDIISLYKNSFGSDGRNYVRRDRRMMNNFNERHKEKLKKTIIRNQDFSKIAKDYDRKGVVQYWDPPYVEQGKFYLTNGVDSKEVCDTMKQIKKAKVFLSYDNNKDVKRDCKGLKFDKIFVPYSVERGGLGKTELLITN